MSLMNYYHKTNFTKRFIGPFPLQKQEIPSKKRGRLFLFATTVGNKFSKEDLKRLKFCDVGGIKIHLVFVYD